MYDISPVWILSRLNVVSGIPELNCNWVPDTAMVFIQLYQSVWKREASGLQLHANYISIKHRDKGLGFQFYLFHFRPVLLWGFFFFFTSWNLLPSSKLFSSGGGIIKLGSCSFSYCFKNQDKKKSLVFILKLFCPYLPEWGGLGEGRFAYSIDIWVCKVEKWVQHTWLILIMTIKPPTKVSH